MKNSINISGVALAILFTLLGGTLLADADAKRKNKCKGGDKRYKQTVRIKGGDNNCGNTGPIGPGWHCVDNFTLTSAFKNKANNDPCKCGGINTAASATAHANLTTRVEHVVISEFSCKGAKKWKGGSSSAFHSIKTPVPMIYSSQETNESYISESRLASGTDTWDYTNNSVTINDLSGHLTKYTDDMVNDFSTFIIEVSKTVGQDAAGEDINTVLYACRATIYNDELIIEDATNTIQASDFTVQGIGVYGKKYTLNISSLAIQLNTDITAADELNVAFYGDCGNYEEGSGGRYALNPTSVKEINEKIAANSLASLNIINNPVIDEDLQFNYSINNLIANQSANNISFTIRDYNGKIVNEWSEDIARTEQTRSIGISNLSAGVYLLTIRIENTDRKQIRH